MVGFIFKFVLMYRFDGLQARQRLLKYPGHPASTVTHRIYFFFETASDCKYQGFFLIQVLMFFLGMRNTSIGTSALALCFKSSMIETDNI